MKKILLIAFAAIVTTACGPSKTVQESKKTLKGYWTLNDISYDRPGTFNVTIFEDTSAECLEGSQWRFIPNNNFGNYEISNTSCPTGKRYFVWTIPDTGDNASNYDIMLKPTDEKMKSTMNNTGFRLALSYLSDDQLQIRQTVQLEGSPFTIKMNFSKNAE
ncbi:lipocalin [Dokdonia sinensis]|uniref:Lipocalin n=1 Tax=Dokdonia sinensis TaxID=2479847 RepID=A0A3M0G7Y6_9FLAO|nr:lipocalin family protein [Dokdonia sinensis]RMB61024.1 lipocalin [Dokdonia sinensis]